MQLVSIESGNRSPVFSGAPAVGLGLSLQKIASNYVSGFIILLDRSIRLNLMAISTLKANGTVTDHHALYRLAHAGGRWSLSSLNILSVISSAIHYSTDTRFRAVTTVQVAYDSDLDRVMPMMVDIASPGIQRDERQTQVVLAGFGDNGVNLGAQILDCRSETGTGGVASDINVAL